MGPSGKLPAREECVLLVRDKNLLGSEAVVLLGLTVFGLFRIEAQ